MNGPGLYIDKQSFESIFLCAAYRTQDNRSFVFGLVLKICSKLDVSK